MQPFGHSTPTIQTDRTDRQTDNGLIHQSEWNLVQTVAGWISLHPYQWKVWVHVNYKFKICFFQPHRGDIMHQLEMWAIAQCDGRPAKHSWRPLFNAAKFDWCPLLVCRAVTLPRRESHWNLQVCPKLVNRSQPLVGRSLPYCGDMCRTYCCLTSFFRLSIRALVVKI